MEDKEINPDNQPLIPQEQNPPPTDQPKEEPPDKQIDKPLEKPIHEPLSQQDAPPVLDSAPQPNDAQINKPVSQNLAQPIPQIVPQVYPNQPFLNQPVIQTYPNQYVQTIVEKPKYLTKKPRFIYVLTWVAIVILVSGDIFLFVYNQAFPFITTLACVGQFISSVHFYNSINQYNKNGYYKGLKFYAVYFGICCAFYNIQFLFSCVEKYADSYTVIYIVNIVVGIALFFVLVYNKDKIYAIRIPSVIKPIIPNAVVVNSITNIS